MDFEQALTRAQSDAALPGGIGILKEKTLHATLKWWLDDDQSHHEIPLPEGFVADIFDGETVTEVQTAGFSCFRPKLTGLLDIYPVRVVHPLVRRKWVRWVDPATGEVGEPHRSPRVGSFTDACRELIYILPCLTHPRLTVELVLLDVEERRLADGWSRDGKRGSHRLERWPLALGERLVLSCPADYAALIPPILGDTFLTEEFRQAARLQGRNLSGALKLLAELGVLTREKEGRGWRYYRARTL